MNENAFKQQLAELPGDDWQAVIDGGALLVVEDQKLEVGPVEASNAIIVASGEADAEALKRESLNATASLLHNYYLTHPLTLAGFNRQVENLIVQHGASAFSALSGQLPPFTLFVDGGEVVAEPLDSPRHRYGVFYELDRTLNDAAVEAHVRKWLQRGEAHERYLEMNVCRYNC